MICKSCGAVIVDNAPFCSQCGARVIFDSEPNQNVNNGYNNGAGNNGTYNNGPYGNGAPGGFNNGTNTNIPLRYRRLNENRSFALWLLLSIITGGIYNWIFMYEVIEDLNDAFSGDGEEKMDFWTFFLLSIVTCGIYAYVWYYRLGNRIQKNSGRYGLNITETGGTIVLLMTVGAFCCGIGPLIAISKIITNTNSICKSYNDYNDMIRRQ